MDPPSYSWMQSQLSEVACLFVVDPERLPELPSHLLLVLLDEELGRQLDELGELQAAGTVLVDLLHNLLEKCSGERIG